MTSGGSVVVVVVLVVVLVVVEVVLVVVAALVDGASTWTEVVGGNAVLGCSEDEQLVAMRSVAKVAINKCFIP